MPLFFLSTRHNITVNYEKDRQAEKERERERQIFVSGSIIKIKKNIFRIH